MPSEHAISEPSLELGILQLSQPSGPEEYPQSLRLLPRLPLRLPVFGLWLVAGQGVGKAQGSGWPDNDDEELRLVLASHEALMVKGALLLPLPLFPSHCKNGTVITLIIIIDI